MVKKDPSVPVPFHVWVLTEKVTPVAVRAAMACGNIFVSEEAAKETKRVRGFGARHLKVHCALILVDPTIIETPTEYDNLDAVEVDVTLFTDGSISKNPGGIGGWGVLAQWQTEAGMQERELKGIDPAPSTNNRAELLAVIHGLRFVAETFGSWKRIRIVTDSEYVLKGGSEFLSSWKQYGWVTAAGEPVKNKELWEAVDKYTNGQVVSWVWVKGHSGNPENDRADKLAKSAWRSPDPSVAS